MSDPLAALILAKLREPVARRGEIVDDILSLGAPREPEAIVLYGSALSDSTRTPTSIDDVYVIVESLWRFHRSPWHVVLNAWLPPNIYFRVADTASAPWRYKMCVIAERHLARATSSRARDLHHLGRFSKRMALLWVRDDTIAARLAAYCASALRALAPYAIATLSDRFSLEDFVRALLGLSYAAEPRLVESSKVEAIWRSERQYYQEIFQLLLAELPHRREGEHYLQLEIRPGRQATEKLLARSRLRERLRWPKYIFTFDRWLDYLLLKLERHHGIRLELTPRERRFPLLFAWGRYAELRRRKIIK